MDEKIATFWTMIWTYLVGDKVCLWGWYIPYFGYCTHIDLYLGLFNIILLTCLILCKLNQRVNFSDVTSLFYILK